MPEVQQTQTEGGEGEEAQLHLDPPEHGHHLYSSGVCGCGHHVVSPVGFHM